MLDPEVVKAFFSKIQKDPYDLDTRKVYADYLEEEGDDSDYDEAAIQRAWTKEKQDSIEWIKDYVKTIQTGYREDSELSEYTYSMTYERFMAAAREWVDNGDYLCFNGITDPDLDPDFWHHYEIATGETVDPEAKRHFFTCSC
jgi:uncharacterized protein (TIGR02996 family)